MVENDDGAELQRKLDDISEWAAQAPDPRAFKNNGQFMTLAVDVMNRCLYLLRVGVALAPNESTAEKGYTKHKAIILGHMVRMAKLYEGFLMHTANGQLELTAIFTRLIFETDVRMRYMMGSKSSSKSIRSFILASYRSERETIGLLDEQMRHRPPTKIESRIRRKILSRLRKDRITLKELRANTVWRMDGKSFRQILREVDGDEAYYLLFGSSSHNVHGDWYEISIHHLRKQGRYYQPDLEYDHPDPRVACAVTAISLAGLASFLEWTKGDPYGLLDRAISRLDNLNRVIDEAHEAMLSN